MRGLFPKDFNRALQSLVVGYPLRADIMHPRQITSVGPDLVNTVSALPGGLRLKEAAVMKVCCSLNLSCRVVEVLPSIAKVCCLRWLCVHSKFH